MHNLRQHFTVHTITLGTDHVHLLITLILQAYMKHFAASNRIGRDPTPEDLARIHNGGPNGYKNKLTVKYWERVKKHL